MHSHQSHSRADLAVLALIALMLAALLAPALAASDAQSDKNLCIHRMKDLALALLNAHDTYGAFPLASTQPLDHPPGSAGDKPSGYSWLVRILPFVEQQPLFHQLADKSRSNKLTIPPFDPAVRKVDGRINRVVMAESIPYLICPSFVGDATDSGTAPEYADLPTDARPAITNYHATAGSHFVNSEGLGRMLTPEQIDKIAIEGNGVIVFPSAVRDRMPKRGNTIASLQGDGSSKTFFFAESNERAYAAWIDGQATWLVSAWPSNPDVPTLQASDTSRPTLGWPADQLANNQVTPGVQQGIEATAEPPIYLPIARWTGKAPRAWGASSNHPEGVGHAFADGHAVMLSRDIDPVVYLHLTTRNGRELLPDGVIR